MAGPCDRIRVVPNGVMVEAITPATPDERSAARSMLGMAASQWAGIFLGSDYAPNVEAARFIIDELAPAMPGAMFVIAGGVGARVDAGAANVIVTGALDDATKLAWLKACDFAVNPMFSGSGTNIKMFDFLAAGLPVVTTSVGARGIDAASRDPFIVTDAHVDAVAGSIRRLQSDSSLYERTALDARACVADGYAWERISPQLGALLRIAHRATQVRRPRFSVVIPSYDRHDHLDVLMPCLAVQTERDFEVVVVDQSPVPWPARNADFGFALHYFHTPIKGAARARNAGAFLASGEIIAFTDDDCRPLPDWLAQARACFSDENVVGIEGSIESDHLDDPSYRPVTNVGFEGLGFMTANLFVRSADFQAIGGFDLAFDRPHFREDTDLGWRLQERGDVPFGRDVRVFHPAQPRSIARESAQARARFFEKDALLYAKHPERYLRLFAAEGHWKKTPGFWEHFRRGGAKYGVDLAPFEELLEKPLPQETAPG
jgi:GT2 family glycosyltransferase